MKIDIHTHTRKIKSGDAATRNIEAKDFIDIIKDTEVKILAITNHNHFDLKQYQEMRVGLDGYCQIWPGIELDVVENGNRAHLLVIANPKNETAFEKACNDLLSNTNPDTFYTSISETVGKFDALDCIYVAHYMGKKPSLSDEDIDALTTAVLNPKRIIKEATNSISTGIYISHGHNSIYGSDVQDWKDYAVNAKDLPDLRLPVESFEQFCLLLEKDEATIDTLLNKKVKESIEIRPFGNAAELVKLDIYNDINILFGSKGTGKTEILKALSKYFNAKGHKTNVYSSSDTHLKETFDLKGVTFNMTAADLGIDECIDEIELIKNATETSITSMRQYEQHFLTTETNKISKNLKIKSISPVDDKLPKRKLKEVAELQKEFNRFTEYITQSKILKDYVEAKLLKELVEVLNKMASQIFKGMDSNFMALKSTQLLNHIVKIFNREISKKTNTPEKPMKTGFADYASNRLKIEIGVNKIITCLNKEIFPSEELAGSLGIKGDVFCRTNVIFQNGRFIDGNYSAVKQSSKTLQKSFAQAIIAISKRIYHSDLFEKISNLNEIENIEDISSLSDMIQFYKHFTLAGKYYEPSNGESSMILLFKEFQIEKDIFLIDEPEKSLGNDYISDVIVPLIKEKALMGKKLIIATHDANIAVRTLPYSSIYRLYENGQHYTMTGNPFSNSLKCIYNLIDPLDWKEISMKTLEGGKAAFGERGKIYGN
jgi:predicted ATPase